MALREVVVVAGCRTAIGGFGGTLKDVRSHELAATVMKGVIRRAKIDPTLIGDIRMGCCFPDIDSMNVARVGALYAGLPNSIPAVTINRVCASGMEAVHSAAQMIATGQHDVVLAGGVESMSTQPYILPTMRWGQRLQDGPCLDRMINNLHAGSQFTPYPADGAVEKFRGKPYIMGMTAEFLAQKHGITREAQDEVALRSHNNVERATKEGLFREEIEPVVFKQKRKTITFDTDEHYKEGITLEKLAGLKANFIPKVGTVTPGNASGINDGASALILVARETADRLGLKPLATISGMAAGANPPEFMGESPVIAVRNLLKRNGRKIEDYGRIELNEAFAAQYLACEMQLGWDRSKANVNGSGIGLGHPVGSTGSRLIVTLIHEMQRSGERLGLASICGGGGVSLATELTAC